LGRDRRAQLVAELGGIFAYAAAAVQVRYFDAEAFGHGYTDFIFAETSDLDAYHFMWERIKDTVLFTVPYFAIKDVVFGIEEGYRAYEREVLGRGNASIISSQTKQEN
jgi:Darcynin, domain of unknown function